MAYASKSQAGSSGPKLPANAKRGVLPKSDSPSGQAPKYLSKTSNFYAGWPKYKDHDPRLIAGVWKDGANYPYQVRTADGTFSQPKGLGQKSRAAYNKDKAGARDEATRDRPNVAGFSPTAK